MKHVKRYWSMGTAGFGQGNATPVAEFNVYHDAEAYKVFVESGVPITVLGFDMMNDDAYGQVILYKEGIGYDSGITFDDYQFHVITKTASKTFKEKLMALL